MPREIEGKLVLDTVEELVDPCYTALLVIDSQNDFCGVGGAFDRNGYDISYYKPMFKRAGVLLDAGRKAGVMPVFIQNTTLPGGESDSPSWLRFRMRLSRDPEVPAIRYTVRGTWGHQVVDELAPRAQEISVEKFRSSAFVATPLDLILRSRGIRTIVAAGASTEGCVESTARDGMFLDYYVVVVRDCVESDTRDQHEASLTLMRNRFDLVNSSDIIQAWENHEVSSPRMHTAGQVTPV